MTDFWAIMGHLVTDDHFRRQLFDSFGQLAGRPYANPGAGMRVAIPGDHYSIARALIQPAIPDQPLSLMALGEILYVSTSPAFRAAVQTLDEAIQASGVLASPPETSDFYVALGAMALDDQLRARLAPGVGTTAFNELGFMSVKPNDRASLKQLFSEARPAVIAAANGVCERSWVPECDVKSFFYTRQGQDHRHPVSTVLP